MDVEKKKNINTFLTLIILLILLITVAVYIIHYIIQNSDDIFHTSGDGILSGFDEDFFHTAKDSLEEADLDIAKDTVLSALVSVKYDDKFRDLNKKEALEKYFLNMSDYTILSETSIQYISPIEVYFLFTIDWDNIETFDVNRKN